MTTKRFIAREWLFILKIILVQALLILLGYASIYDKAESVDCSRWDLNYLADNTRVSAAYYHKDENTEKRFKEAENEPDAWTVAWVRRHEFIENFEYKRKQYILLAEKFGRGNRNLYYGGILFFGGVFYGGVWFIRSIKWAVKTSRE